MMYANRIPPQVAALANRGNPQGIPVNPQQGLAGANISPHLLHAGQNFTAQMQAAQRAWEQQRAGQAIQRAGSNFPMSPQQQPVNIAGLQFDANGQPVNGSVQAQPVNGGLAAQQSANPNNGQLAGPQGAFYNPQTNPQSFPQNGLPPQVQALAGVYNRVNPQPMVR